MSLLDRLRGAAGGSLWYAPRWFRGFIAIRGGAVARLQETYDLQEIVAEGDIANPSIRMSGFSDVTDWCVHPQFVAIGHNDGRFLGARRPSDGWRLGAGDALEEIYVCSVGAWLCMTLPLTFLGGGVLEDLGTWTESGEQWRRIKIYPSRRISFTHERATTLYIDRKMMLRRIDCTTLWSANAAVTVYCSAFHEFQGLTMPTLFRAFRRLPRYEHAAPSVLDIEVFDATFRYAAMT